MFLQEFNHVWTDEDYQASLDEATLAQFPAHPAGLIELDDAKTVAPNGNATNLWCRLLCASLLLSILASIFDGLASRPALAHEELAPAEVECDVNPTSIDDLMTIWFETSRRLPVYAPYAVESTVPIGPLVDPETAADVQLTIARVYACLAAGDYLRFFAMLTNDFASELGPPRGATVDEVTAHLNRSPVPDEDAPTLVAVTNVMVIDDHRIGAFVIDRYGEISSTSYATLVQVGERWLVDSVKYFVK